MKQAQARVHAPAVVIEGEVSRMIRQHGRSSPKAEVCGVLIGREERGTTYVDACIQGVNAAQGGAHVTFTQETWEHIYRTKDRDFPDARIVGWYHSHPGFGVFLSDHDLFIQQNFFSSPQQIAWVYDPHSDEEGCFGWRGDKIEKLDDVSFRYVASLGELRDDIEDEGHVPPPPRRERRRTWLDHVLTFVSYIVVFLFGGIAMWWYIQPALNRAAVQVYEEGLKHSFIRDCGNLIGAPAPQPPASGPARQEGLDAPKR